MNRELLSKALCEIDESFIAEAYRPVPEAASSSSERIVPMKKKRIITFALAAALILSLGIVAYATGFVSAITELARSFYKPVPDEEMRNERPEAAEYNENWNSQMDEWIEIGENSDKTTQSAELEDGTTITLTENFYDGERLALSYILNTEGSRIDYDFGPDHEFFDLLSESNGLLWYQDLSETQYLEIMAKLKLTGKVGFIIRTVNVGDHVTLSDGTDIGPFVGGELDGYTVLVPQNGLPDSAKGQDKLDVVFHVKTYEAYIWLEGDKVYSYYPIVEGVPVTFEIINNTAN